LGGGAELRDSGFDFGVGVEVELDDAEARQRLRLHVFDVVDVGGKGALATDGNDVGHFLRRDAAIGPDDADDWDIDLGEDVGRHAEDGEAAESDDEQGHDDECVRSSEGEADYPHTTGVILL